MLFAAIAKLAYLSLGKGSFFFFSIFFFFFFFCYEFGRTRTILVAPGMSSVFSRNIGLIFP